MCYIIRNSDILQRLLQNKPSPPPAHPQAKTFHKMGYSSIHVIASCHLDKRLESGGEDSEDLFDQIISEYLNDDGQNV